MDIYGGAKVANLAVKRPGLPPRALFATAASSAPAEEGRKRMGEGGKRRSLMEPDALHFIFPDPTLGWDAGLTSFRPVNRVCTRERHRNRRACPSQSAFESRPRVHLDLLVARAILCDRPPAGSERRSEGPT